MIEQQATKIKELEDEVNRLNEQLAVERTQTDVYREHIRRRARQDNDVVGTTENVDWGKRLDEYLTEVSVRVRGKEFSGETLASCAAAPVVLTFLS